MPETDYTVRLCVRETAGGPCLQTIGDDDRCPTHGAFEPLTAWTAAVRDLETTIETCLVCKVAWDTALDPPECSEPSHPHALNLVKDWNEVGRGRAE